MKIMKNVVIVIVLLVLLVVSVQSVSAGVPKLKLVLSHIECVDNQVEVHFILHGTQVGDDISNITYTYGTVSPGARTGGVVHFTDLIDDVYVEVTYAWVFVNGTQVYLHNPLEYSGSYNCGQSIIYY